MTTPNIRPHRASEPGRRDDDDFNEAFHTILRKAAERREDRQRLNQRKDEAEAREAWQDLVALTRASSQRS